ncbi:SDR family oxidoreductase [Paenibacillus aurantius]|uniref:SDR family oxidoreductase n=1 Tax=Paenibacillus aurantius TaxID=2918900 RepID=A0AA96RGU3_9BACL|nr:UDP-glucuronic acid decarboxylase family protein [Paenibacillus aurantius]WNQ12851.1 SDR family oxidoreductase [Paenibacillus aurantius]
MRKVVLTGAAGFLGYHLAVQLLKEGCVVIGLDNLSTGQKDNIKKLKRSERFLFIQGDAASPMVMDLPELQRADEIYHLASPASPKFYQSHPLETIEVNTRGTFHMLELCRRNKAKLLYTSTSEAYGDPAVHPQSETYRGNVNTWGPRACYDEAKRLGETYCYEYFTKFGVPVKVARIFNTYSAGLRNDDGRVISNFVTQALTGQDITVYGDGSQTRSFCYVDDTVRGLMLMMRESKADGEILNIGNPEEYTILEVARKVKQVSGSESRIVYQDLPKDDPMQRRPDITKARQVLGWSPLVPLEEGLKRTIQAYSQLLRGKRQGEL